MNQDPGSSSSTTPAEAIGKARRTSPVPTALKIKRLLWSLVEATAYRWSFHTWSGWRACLLRLFGARIGRSCTIRRTSRVYYPWNLQMGDESALGDDCEIYNLALVTLGQRVSISQEAYLCAGTHDYNDPRMPLVTVPIILGDDVWVCARAFIGPGVMLGEGAIAAACAVVVKDVAPWTIVGGNPAKAIKARAKLERVR